MTDRLLLPGFSTSPRGYIDASAVLSPCENYRYELRRRWALGSSVIFIGLNPSTASSEAQSDDATIKTCVRYAKHWGAGELIMLNLFAYRSRDPKALRKIADPIGPECDAHIRRALDSRPLHVVAAWGAHEMTGGRDADVARLVREVTGNVPALSCLALNGDASPHHPLYLPSDLNPQPYPYFEGETAR